MPHIQYHMHNFFHYFLNRELIEIYLTIAVRAFAISLIGIFVPIYLFKMGFSLHYIFLFYAIASAVFSSTVFLSAKLSTKIGIKHGILISMPFLIAYYLLLRSITINSLNWLFFLTPIIAGIHSSLFWVNFHIDFAAFSSKKIRAEQISGSKIFSALLSALGPIAGAFFISYIGFHFLFVLVSALLLISIIPLFKSEEAYIHKSFSFKQTIKIIKKIGITGLSGFIGYGAILCASLAWILFMFLILKSYLGVGLLMSAVLLVGIVSTFFVGKLADKYGKGQILKIGSMLSAIGWFFVFFVNTVFEVFGINIFFGVTSAASAGGSAFDAFNYDMAKKGHIPEIIAIREVTLNGSEALLLFLLFFVGTFHTAFIFGALGSFLILLFSFQKRRA